MAIIDIFKTEKKVDSASDEGFLTEVSFVEEDPLLMNQEKKSGFSKRKDGKAIAGSKATGSTRPR